MFKRERILQPRKFFAIRNQFVNWLRFLGVRQMSLLVEWIAKVRQLVR